MDLKTEKLFSALNQTSETAIKAFEFARESRERAEKIAAMVAAFPIIAKGDKGDRGEPGQSVDPVAVNQTLAELVAKIPPARDGRDGKDADQRALESRVDAYAASVIPKAVKSARTAALAAVPEIVKTELAQAVASLPPAEPGAPGKDGADGKDGDCACLARAWKGNWNKDTPYSRGDVFGFRGASYVVLRDCRGVLPSVSSQRGKNPYYAVLAAAGAPGMIPDLTGTYQPLDADLTAIAALSSTGYARRTGDSAWTLDSTIPSASVLVDRISGSTYSTLQEFINTMHSPGLISGGELSVISATQVRVAAGNGMVRILDDDVSSLRFFDWAQTDFTVPNDDQIRHFGVVYNGGTPIVEMRTAEDWDKDTEFALGTALRGSTAGFFALSNPFKTGDPITNIIQRFDAGAPVERDAYVGGLMISNTGTRNIAISAGQLWHRLNDNPFPAFDSSASSTFFTVYYNGTNWVYTPSVTQWPNTEYNDVASGLATMTANRFANLWFYVGATGTNVFMVYGQAQHVLLADALDEGEPTFFPTNARPFVVLVGKLTFKKGDTTPNQLLSPFTGASLGFGSINVHNDLSGLQGGTASEYYHLTSAQHTSLTSLAQGDILYASATNVLSSLPKNTTATRYLSNTGASNNPAWAQIDLTNGVTGILPSGNGGTGNGFTKFTGPATAERTFTLPNSDATLLYSGGALGTPASGTVTNLTGTASININGTVGATTPSTGVFTSLASSGDYAITRNNPAIVMVGTEGSGLTAAIHEVAGHLLIGRSGVGDYFDINLSTGSSSFTAINSTPIGATTPSTVAATTLAINGDVLQGNSGAAFSDTGITGRGFYASRAGVAAYTALAVGSNSTFTGLTAEGSFGSLTAAAANRRTGLNLRTFGGTTWATNGSAALQTTETQSETARGSAFIVETVLNGATSNTERFRISGTGSVELGVKAAIATNATDGFVYVPTCAGTPTGTPTAITGLAPIVVNTTNNKLYFYSGGAWRDAGP